MLPDARRLLTIGLVSTVALLGIEAVYGQGVRPAVPAHGGAPGGAAPPSFDPVTGLPIRGAAAGQPVNPATGLPLPVDPATGLPMPDPSTEWKDPKWKDPDKVLGEVSFNGAPIGEVARDLRKQFNDAFDVVIPNNWQNPNNPSVVTDPGNTPIQIQLKNVTVSEVFNAMNLAFDAENTPMHWELKMNGSRPTVVLRVFPNATPFPQELPKRQIFFVGEMLGEEKSGGMTMEQLVKTISEVYDMSYGRSQGEISSHLQFHKQAQLLIVTGSNDEIIFVEQTLTALRQKIALQRRLRPPPPVEANDGAKPETKPAKEKPKSP